MRFAFCLGLVLMTAVTGCSSTGVVSKEEEKVTIKDFPSRPRSERQTLAVIDFADKTGYGKGRIGTAAADILINYLSESKQFRVIERTQIAKVLQEHKLEQSGITDAATAVKVGKLLNVKLLAYGTVTNFGMREESTEAIIYQKKSQIAECAVTVRLIDVATGEILLSKMGDGKASREVKGSLGLGGRMSYDESLAGDSLRAAIAKFVDSMVESAY